MKNRIHGNEKTKAEKAENDRKYLEFRLNAISAGERGGLCLSSRVGKAEAEDDDDNESSGTIGGRIADTAIAGVVVFVKGNVERGISEGKEDLGGPPAAGGRGLSVRYV